MIFSPLKWIYSTNRFHFHFYLLIECVALRWIVLTYLISPMKDPKQYQWESNLMVWENQYEEADLTILYNNLTSIYSLLIKSLLSHYLGISIKSCISSCYYTWFSQLLWRDQETWSYCKTNSLLFTLSLQTLSSTLLVSPFHSLYAFPWNSLRKTVIFWELQIVWMTVDLLYQC